VPRLEWCRAVEVVGVNKGSVSLSDFDHADLIFVVGQNPGTNHPRMLTTLREAAKRGATIVAINPLREVGLTRFAHPQKPLDFLGGVELAKHFVQIQIGGDQAFFLGVSKAVLELDTVSRRGKGSESTTVVERVGGPVLDLLFLGELTDGFPAWRAHVEATSWAQIVAWSGVDEDTIRKIAELYAQANAVIACWAMGLTQHKHAVVTIQEIVNFMLLRGNVGRPGAGLCPVRGHSNVQGDRHDGHLPPAATRVSRRARRGVRVLAAAHAGVRHRRDRARARGWPRRRVRRARRQLRDGGARHRATFTASSAAR